MHYMMVVALVAMVLWPPHVSYRRSYHWRSPIIPAADPGGYGWSEGLNPGEVLCHKPSPEFLAYYLTSPYRVPTPPSVERLGPGYVCLVQP